MEIFLGRYIEYMKNERDLNENTLKSYINDMENFKAFLEKQSIEKLESVNKTLVINYLIDLEKQGRATSTIARNLSSIKSYYQFLLNKGYVSHNPTINLKAPKVERKIPNILTKEEVDILMDQPDKHTFKGLRDRAMLELMYSTGIGVNEIISIDIKDMDLDMGTLLVENNSESRVVPVGSYALRALEAYMKKLEATYDTGVLFVNSRGDRISRQGFWKNLKEYEEMSNIKKKITPQILRQSFAVHMIENGADLEVVQKMLGHSDPTTTQIYLYKSTGGNIREVHRKSHPRA